MSGSVGRLSLNVRRNRSCRVGVTVVWSNGGRVPSSPEIRRSSRVIGRSVLLNYSRQAGTGARIADVIWYRPVSHA